MAVNKMRISVRNLVEFILRSGDLDNRFMSTTRAVEGTRIHQQIQSKQGKDYQAEVQLVYTQELSNYTLTIEGRADGIIKNQAGVIIDEIKTTTTSLELIDQDYNKLHWAQAKSYAYIYARQNKLDKISVRLTYYQLDTEEIKYLYQDYTDQELEVFFTELVNQYLNWSEMNYSWQQLRDKSIAELDFPFDSYRKGQRELAVAVYKTIVDQKKLFVQAPTGTGKTVSAIFPTIKALGQGLTAKIFYLTAKTITRQVAEETITKLTTQGLKIKTLTLTAKDKICFCEETNCNPEDCKFARGHFERVNQAIQAILADHNLLTREAIEKFAREYQICPFEFSLDLTLWVDMVICDYNYLFDPRVYLRRFFTDKGDYIFLIDEAHNLLDRAREMYSAALDMSRFAKLSIKHKRAAKLIKIMQQIQDYFLDKGWQLKKKDDFIVQKEEPEGLYPHLLGLLKLAEEILVTEQRNVAGYDELLDLYFESLAFIRIGELYGENYKTYIQQLENDDIRIKLYCLDPALLLKGMTNQGEAGIFFSATLTPLSYFREVLGGDEDDYQLELFSPFTARNLFLMIADNISTRYRDRDKSYSLIADYIKETVSQHLGNYLVFFPSYQYLDRVYNLFIEKFPLISTLSQSPGMSEVEREEFLERFVPEPTGLLVGFAVLGGIFSEGIDLKGERLSGAIVIGVGHPRISLERDLIKEYFQVKNGTGYEYAYTFPGMNKVQQAAGRVIRSEQDRGLLLLIGDRFMSARYQQLFPRKWNSFFRVQSQVEIQQQLTKFWRQD